MLTSFFNKSKPIHFIIVGIYMSLFYVIANFSVFEKELNFLSIGQAVLGLLAYLVTMVILNFIANRNELTMNNSYKMILFAAFSAMFLEGLENINIVFANLFVILAVRRIISLKSQRFVKEKIFDAVFWICVASLFWFWSIIFLFLVILGIIMYTAKNIKNWLIPPVAFLAVLSLVTAFHVLVYDDFYTFSEWFQPTGSDFSYYRSAAVLFLFSFILALTLWAGAYYLSNLQKASAVIRSSLILVLFYLLLAVFAAVLAPVKDTGEILFYTVPLAIIVAIYFDVVPDKWFKEAIFIVLLLLPFVLSIFS